MHATAAIPTEQTMHTRGPWILTEAEGGGWFVDQESTKYRIAFVYSDDPIERRVSPQNRADAHLIAAAPELLAELRDAADAIQSSLNGSGYRPGSCTDEWVPEIRQQVAALARIRATIAKAQGIS